MKNSWPFSHAKNPYFLLIVETDLFDRFQILKPILIRRQPPTLMDFSRFKNPFCFDFFLLKAPLFIRQNREKLKRTLQKEKADKKKTN